MSHELPLPETPRAALAHAVSDEHVLWTVTMLAFVLDVLTTLYGLGRGLAELNPVVLALIPVFGPVGALISLKLVVLAVAVVAWRVLPSRYRGAIPIGVAVPWGVAGLMNTQLILVTVFG
ncbi:MULTISPECIES: DUF5658 family protein [Haloferax]|uniref:DUF5658 domain-containing protein n=2 Tax=Haloferax volcanii TaxID=2246 RepID=A0A558FYJ7_HALVO|nr:MULTISPECIES: DUF5658 family protein [Haloferax]ELK55698.1 hypothetical protein D320_03181 [Haloferax sp. BAB-2207]ELZ93920.1 hypothetical protein C452_03562 [Haloferax alexandrinus JCM 10717]MBC9986200.1 hypothetical protein [Haloferax sp. AS1]NLV02353.1 hypothetical protein [Haloferax alexandrinus]TVT90558.1 hypothetical protein FQA18_18015 [Haloferax volcanii]